MLLGGNLYLLLKISKSEQKLKFKKLEFEKLEKELEKKEMKYNNMLNLKMIKEEMEKTEDMEVAKEAPQFFKVTD